MPRCVLLALSLSLLAGCQKDFDSQYAETEKRLRADANRLDNEMAIEATREPGDKSDRKTVR